MSGPEKADQAEQAAASESTTSEGEGSPTAREVRPAEVCATTSESAREPHPGIPDDDPEVRCPSCGRFAGTYERCPYCGAGLKVRLSVRVLRRLSLGVALLGVFVIWWAARQMEIPFVKVGDFSPTHNFAILRVRGKIVSGPFFGDRGDSFYAGIDDGTGRINIRAYGSTAKDIRAKDIARGDVVEARGSIRVQAGKPPAMSVAVARHVTLVEQAPRVADAAPVTLEAITREMGLGKVRVKVRGRLEECYENEFGRGCTLRDPTGTLVVWSFERDLEDMGAAARLLKDGQGVTVHGRLSIYTNRSTGEETLQVIPESRPDGIVADPGATRGLPPMESAARPPSRQPAVDISEVPWIDLGDVDREKAAQKLVVRARGRLEGCSENEHGIDCTLRDPTGALAVWTFKRDLEAMGPAARLLESDTGVAILGKLSIYEHRATNREILQLIPLEHPEAIVLSPEAALGLPPIEEDEGADPAPVGTADEGADPAPVGTADDGAGEG